VKAAIHLEFDAMDDGLRYRGEPDSTPINLKAIGEVIHWCQRFGCSEAQLRAAIKVVGISSGKVRKHLGR
jgi:hypothetical protein